MVTQHTSTPPHQHQEMPQQTLWRLISGCLVSQAICVAAKLEIADLLKDGPKSSEELAQATRTHAPSLYRLLRALASVGIFIEDDQGRFALTPLGEPLRKGVPGSLHAGAMLFGSTLEWQTLGQLLYSVQTGTSAFKHVFGVELWDYYAQHPEEHEIFQYAMTSFSTAETSAILQAYDFSAFQSVVDVAGGHGMLLAAILNAYPTMRGTLLELPEVAQQAKAVFEAKGVAQRCESVSGDMFVSIPAGHDAYIMKTVIHDWNDQQAITLLQTCRKAMSAQAKLLLVSEVIAPANIPDPSKFMDLNMLASFGGCERTAAEFKTLLTAADLQLIRIIPTRSPLSILECTIR